MNARVKYNLVYQNDRTGRFRYFYFNLDGKYERDDGMLFDTRELLLMYTWVKNKKPRSTVEWITNDNGFKVRVKR